MDTVLESGDIGLVTMVAYIYMYQSSFNITYTYPYTLRLLFSIIMRAPIVIDINNYEMLYTYSLGLLDSTINLLWHMWEKILFD